MGTRYGLEIRAAAAADAPGLAALLGAAGLAVSAADLAGRLDALGRAGGTALVAVEWGPPSGIVALSPCPTLAAPRAFALIDLLLVAPDARRRGIGRVLIKAAARAARQAACDRLLLPPGPGRPDLDAFAAATGFVPDETGFRVRPLLRRGSAEA